MVREEILLPVVRRAAVHREPAFENQGVSAEIPRQRQMGAQGEVSASVSRRVELEVRIPIDIFLYLASDGAVCEIAGLIDLRILSRQEITHLELRVGMHVDAYAGINRAYHAVAVPRLRLNEEAVRDNALVNRVARIAGIDEPVLVVNPLRRLEFARLRVPLAPLVRIAGLYIRIDLAPRAVLERMAYEYRRKVGQRKIAVRHPLQRKRIRLGDEEGVVAVGILRLGVGQLHRHARRHLERRIGNGPRADHAAVFLLLDVIVVIGRMHRIAFARMVERHREVVVLGAGPDILAARSPRLVIDVEPRRRRDVLRVHDVEVLLAETLLSRFEVGHADDRLLRIVEGHVLHIVRVGIVGTRETEVEVLGPPEIVHRQRSLSESALRDVAHLFAVERIVDAPVGQRRVQRSDLNAVVVAPDVPAEVVQRADRIAEKIGFERLADLALLLGRILRLLFALLALFRRLFERIVAVQAAGLPALLRTHQRLGVEALRTDDAGRCQKQTEQSCQQYSFRQSRHRTGIRGKGN